MLQLANETPFTAAMAVLPDRAGIDTLDVVGRPLRVERGVIRRTTAPRS